MTTSTAKRTARKVSVEARKVRSTTSSWVDRVQAALPGPVERLIDRARKDDIMLLSAGLGFYALVSIGPLLILVMWITSLVLGDQRIHALAQAIGRVGPKEWGADRALLAVADQGTRVGVAAVITGLWPASAYGAGLSRAFSRLSPKDTKMRGLRGRGLLLLGLFPVFVLASLATSYAGSQALGQGTLGRVVGVGIALVAGFVGAATAIVLIYWIFPPDRLPWRAIFEAAGTAAVGISLLSLGLTLFLTLGSNFEQHYASSGLALIVLVALWLFLANALILVAYKGAQETS